MNKLDTSATVREDVNISYREMAIAAGWQLYKPSASFSSSYFLTAANYVSSSAPSLMTFSAQTVDFAHFLEAENDTNFISATRTTACATLILAVALITLF
jgi:hypothetical protein